MWTNLTTVAALVGWLYIAFVTVQTRILARHAMRDARRAREEAQEAIEGALLAIEVINSARQRREERRESVSRN